MLRCLGEGPLGFSFILLCLRPSLDYENERRSGARNMVKLKKGSYSIWYYKWTQQGALYLIKDGGISSKTIDSIWNNSRSYYQKIWQII